MVLVGQLGTHLEVAIQPGHLLCVVGPARDVGNASVRTLGGVNNTSFETHLDTLENRCAINWLDSPVQEFLTGEAQ